MFIHREDVGPQLTQKPLATLQTMTGITRDTQKRKNKDQNDQNPLKDMKDDMEAPEADLDLNEDLKILTLKVAFLPPSWAQHFRLIFGTHRRRPQWRGEEVPAPEEQSEGKSRKTVGAARVARVARVARGLGTLSEKLLWNFGFKIKIPKVEENKIPNYVNVPSEGIMPKRMQAIQALRLGDYDFRSDRPDPT